ERIEQLQVGEILFGDHAGGHVAWVELGALDQMEQEVKRPLVDGEPEARARLGARRRGFGRVAHSSTRAIALITASTAFVYSSANNIRNPYGSRRAKARAAPSGKTPTTTRPPSSGSSGSRLKTASTILMTTDARSISAIGSATISPHGASMYGATRRSSAALAAASAKLVSGPAAATAIIPARRGESRRKSTGTGLA